MPLYEYQCDACGHRFEVIQKYSDAPITVCPKCHGAVRKLFSSPAIQFKGSGFYITDYARAGKSGTESSSSGQGESKSESKSESKAESSEKKADAAESKGESKSEGKDSTKKESKTEGKSESKNSEKPSASKPTSD